VLAERIVAEQDVVPREIRRHAVGPVEHRHLDEDKFLAVADLQRVACLHDMEIPLPVILAGQGIDCLRGAIDRTFGDELHEAGQ
jgi:hypothetical protein